jgi:hypothetical protein
VENQGEVQGPMAVALSVSLLAIFLILVLQFRTVRHPLVIMVSIPLALFGSALGLALTGNPFGFTANLGLTALTGVVVRNAIILVDYALARRRDGEALDLAALDAGRRRLRPIFLTTMAAAVAWCRSSPAGRGCGARWRACSPWGWCARWSARSWWCRCCSCSPRGGRSGAPDGGPRRDAPARPPRPPAGRPARPRRRSASPRRPPRRSPSPQR